MLALLLALGEAEQRRLALHVEQPDRVPPAVVVFIRAEHGAAIGVRFEIRVRLVRVRRALRRGHVEARHRLRFFAHLLL